MDSMGSTRHGWAGALFAAVLILGQGLYAQSALPSGQLGAEVQRLEHSLAQGSSADRHEALVRLARLLQLSGNFAGAATRWLEAAAANPQDDGALVAGAHCLAATGEWERALQVLRPLLSSGRQGQPVLQARYLDACLRARMSGNASGLADLAQDPEFSSLHPLIYYTLWQITAENPGVSPAGSAESWRGRLISEFPSSPEARAADTGRAGTSVSIVQSPLWLLFPGTGSSPAVSGTVPASQNAPSAATPGAAASAVLQTGLFGREANARGQAEALRRAGFSATVTRRMVNNAERWAVTVPAGQNATRTMDELKRAGFDSFPVRNN